MCLYCSRGSVVPRALAVGAIFTSVLLVNSAFVFSQTNDNSIKAGEIEIWHLKLDAITKDILVDATVLDNYDRAVLWARLGGLWWKQDRPRALQWFHKALDATKQSDQKETLIDRESRYSLVNTLVPLIAPFEPNLATEMVESLKDSKANTQRDNKSAEALVRSALSVVTSNPALAATLGSAAIQTGDTYLIFNLIRSLRLQDPKLSEALLDEVLTAASIRLSEELINNAIIFVYPKLSDPAKPDEIPPALKLRVLRIVVARMSLTGDEETTCHVAAMAAPLAEEYDRLFPEGRPYLTQRISMCRPSLDGVSQTAMERSGPADMGVEEALKAFHDARTPQMRTWYLTHALDAAAKGRNYELAIRILDDLTQSERELLGTTTWQSLRWDSASSAAYARYQLQDLDGMNKVIAATPPDLRALVEGFLARKLVKSPEVAVGLLEDARRDLSKIEKGDRNLQGLALNLLRLYAVLKPSEVITVFKEAMKTFDEITSANSEKKTSVEVALTNPLVAVSLPKELMQENETTIRDVISALNPRARAQVRLGWLEGIFQQEPIRRRVN